MCLASSPRSEGFRESWHAGDGSVGMWRARCTPRSALVIFLRECAPWPPGAVLAGDGAHHV